ncbi:MAG: DnaD domain protein, partial [Massilioclostridium sp.]|nr:DnaD domain protein [Massilioclostridium sp.]
INMIRLAYERTIDSIGELSFPYINKILSEWHKHSIATPEQANSRDAKPAPKQSDEAPSYDLDKLSKRGMFIPEV